MPTVALRELPRVLTAQQAKIHKATIKGVVAGAQAAVPMLRRETPKDRGHAQAAWHWRRGHGSPGPVAVVFNDDPIIGLLEKGTRPHRVNLEGQRAIYEWVERHYRLAGGIVLSTRDMGEGIKSDSLTNTRSRAHKVARGNGSGVEYLNKLSKLGAMLEDNLVRNFPDMGRRLVPAALNIAAAIIHKIRTKGSKPHYFVRDSLELMAQMVRGEVERNIAEVAQHPAGGNKR